MIQHRCASPWSIDYGLLCVELRIAPEAVKPSVKTKSDFGLDHSARKETPGPSSGQLVEDERGLATAARR